MIAERVFFGGTVESRNSVTIEPYQFDGSGGFSQSGFLAVWI